MGARKKYILYFADKTNNNFVNMVDLNSFTLSTDSEAIKFLEDHLNEILEDQKADILGQLKIRLLSLPIAERGGFKGKLLEFLKNNNSSLTSQPITKNSGMRLPPTVSNWLNDYFEYSGEKDDQSKKEEYFQKSQSFRALSPEERQSLRKLLELFSFLNMSADSAEGLEEEIVVKDREGRMKVLKKGEFTDLARPSASFQIKKTERLEVPKIEPAFQESGTKAAFYFHPEDEEEFKEHQERINQFELPKTHNIEVIIEEIIRENNLTFSDEILRKRFESVAKARLKELRGEIDTKDLLTRPVKIGGMGYDDARAGQIINSIKQRIPKMHELIKDEEAAEETIKMIPKIESLEIPKPPQIPKPLVSEAPVPVEIRQEVKVVEPPPFKPIPKQKVMPRMMRPEVEPERRRIEDIRRPTRLVGPVEELRNLALSDLRRLGTAYIGSIRKLYEKINLLGEESFAKRAEGIRAWRQSPVYELYLEMGRESMEIGKSIREVVEARKNQGSFYLTEQEFNGLADLNKRLRF